MHWFAIEKVVQGTEDINGKMVNGEGECSGAL